MAQSMLSRYERRGRRLPRSLVARFARALKTSTDEPSAAKRPRAPLSYGLAAGDDERQSPPIPAPAAAGPRHDQRPSRRRDAERYVRVRQTAGGLERIETVKKIQYLVRISRDPHSDWGASVPDLPGCVATGKTLDTVLRRIERAIALHVRGLRDDGLPV